MSELDKIEIHERKVTEELLGNPPSWFLRWGITILSLVILAILIFSIKFQLPETLDAEVLITTTPEPISIYAEKTGYLDTLLIPDSHTINEGESIAKFKTKLNTNSLRQIDTFLSQLKQIQNISDYTKLIIPEAYELDELSSDYLRLFNAYTDLVNELSNKSNFRENEMLRKRIELTSLNDEINLDAKRILLNEKELVDKDLDRNQTLNEKGVISDVILEEKTKDKLEIDWRIKQNELNRYLADLQKRDFEDQIVKNTDQKSSKVKLLEIKLKQETFSFYTKLRNWKEDNIVKSPVTGKLTYMFTEKNRPFVSSGSKIFTVVPSSSDSSSIVAKFFVNSNKFGKISIGNRIIIKLKPYPYEEYGVIETEVSKMSNIPIESDESTGNYFYLIEANLGKALITSYGKKLELKNQLDGTAQITSKERTLFQRVFQNLTSDFKLNAK